MAIDALEADRTGSVPFLRSPLTALRGCENFPYIFKGALRAPGAGVRVDLAVAEARTPGDDAGELRPGGTGAARPRDPRAQRAGRFPP